MRTGACFPDAKPPPRDQRGCLPSAVPSQVEVFGVGVAQEIVVGDLPPVGARVREDHHIARSDPGHLDPTGQDVLGCAQLPDHGNGLLAQLGPGPGQVPGVGRNDREGVAVLPGGRQAELVGAAADDRVGHAAVVFDVQDLNGVVAEGGSEEPPALEIDFAPVAWEGDLDQLTQLGGETLPVESVLQVDVVDADTPADVDDLATQPEPLLPGLRLAPVQVEHGQVGAGERLLDSECRWNPTSRTPGDSWAVRTASGKPASSIPNCVGRPAMARVASGNGP